MGELPELLNEEIIMRAKKLSSTLLSDAMDCTGGMDYQIKPVCPGTKVVGTAITVSLRPGDNLFLHEAIYSGGKGYVLIVDGKGHVENAYIGELMTAAAKVVGLEGIIVDGLARDKDTLEKMGYPLFCKGFIPNGPLKDGPGEINKVITCGGVVVQPGDLVLGDDDGVVVVPRDRIPEALTKAEQKLAYEEERIDIINNYPRNGASLEPDWLKEKKGKFN